MVYNNLYKSIVEHSPVGYSYNKIIYDENGQAKDYKFIEVNKAYASMMGFEVKDMIGKKNEFYI